MISREELLQGQACPPALETNLQALLKSLNTFRQAYDHPMVVTSGYRTPEHNQEIGGASNSSHILCMAADFHDLDGSLKVFILSHPEALSEADLYCEDWRYQPTGDSHIHLQTRVPASGKRIFIP